MAAKVDRTYLTQLSLGYLPFPRLDLLVLSSLQAKEEGTIAATYATWETSAAVGLVLMNGHSSQSSEHSRWASSPSDTSAPQAILVPIADFPTLRIRPTSMP